MTEQSFPAVSVIIGRHMRRQGVHPVNKRLMMRPAGIVGGVGRTLLPYPSRSVRLVDELASVTHPYRVMRAVFFVKRTQRPNGIPHPVTATVWRRVEDGRDKNKLKEERLDQLIYMS